MEIAKTHHESGLGIYAESKPVKTKDDWKKAKEVSHETIAFMDEHNGSFDGHHSKAYALAHCQVAPVSDPWQFFVVDKSMVYGKQKEKDPRMTLKNALFEAQAIFNAEILEAPTHIKKEVPQRIVTRDENDRTQVSVEVGKETQTLKNMVAVPEACMSFPLRKARNTERYYEIKVRYQYIGKLGMVKTFTGWVSGLKAHIIQHETDHFQGKNIFHKK